MKKRTISTIQSRVQSLPLPPEPATTTLHNWLTEQARTYTLRWLLAHMHDGVIWGEMRDNTTIHLSCEAFPQGSLALRWSTLQQCRLFGEHGELLVWDDGMHGWHARLRQDNTSDGTTIGYLDEKHLLWGTQADNPINNFRPYREGTRGTMHYPPLQGKPDNTRRAALHVRHYLSEETTTGLVRITASRLVDLLEPHTRACPNTATKQGGPQ